MFKKKWVSIDRPRPGVPLRRYGGFLEVSGWAAASEPVVDIRVRADDGPWSRAVYCQPRPDVQAVHQRLPGAGRSGFQAFVHGGPSPRRVEVSVAAGRKRWTYGTAVPIQSEVCDIELVEPPRAPCPWCGGDAPRWPEPTARGPFRADRCGRCDFGFAGPLPTPSSIASLYATEYWDQAPLGPDLLHPSADTAFVCDLLERYGNGGRRVLEVGCGQGSLLFGLRERGLEVRGQDLSQNSAKALEEHCGVPIWRQPLASLDTELRFDCIVTRHVIEHSLTPRLDLQWIRDHLAPGGIAVLLTPNRRSLGAELFGASWEWFVPPIHVGYFSPRSLQCAGAAVGLRLRHLTTREGDAAPLLPTLQAFRAYYYAELSAWQQQRCEELLALGEGGVERMLAQGGGAAGLGQELIAVLAAA
jgi:SAM-dependent methyltransferase